MKDCRICESGGKDAFVNNSWRSGEDTMQICGLSDDGSVGAIACPSSADYDESTKYHGSKTDKH